MNLRVLLTAIWLCVVAAIYLALYLICQLVHARFAVDTFASNGKGVAGPGSLRRKGRTGSASNLLEAEADYYYSGSQMWLVDGGDTSDDDSDAEVLEGDPV